MKMGAKTKNTVVFAVILAVCSCALGKIIRGCMNEETTDSTLRIVEVHTWSGDYEGYFVRLDEALAPDGSLYSQAHLVAHDRDTTPYEVYVTTNGETKNTPNDSGKTYQNNVTWVRANPWWAGVIIKPIDNGAIIIHSNDLDWMTLPATNLGRESQEWRNYWLQANESGNSNIPRIANKETVEAIRSLIVRATYAVKNQNIVDNPCANVCALDEWSECYNCMLQASVW